MDFPPRCCRDGNHTAIEHTACQCLFSVPNYKEMPVLPRRLPLPTTAGITAIVSGGLLVMLALPAAATLTDSLTIGSAKAVALGHAVTADPPGIDSVHFNPAGLINLKGRQSHFKTVAGTFGIDMAFGDYDPETAAAIDAHRDQPYFQENDAHQSTGTTEGASLMLPFVGMTDVPVLFAPLGGVSYAAPDGRMTVATNVYSPMMVGLYRAEDDPSRWIGQRMSFMVITYFSPSFAYRINDEWTVGAAMTFNYGGVGFELPFRGGNPSIFELGELQQGPMLNCTGADPDKPPLELLCGGNFSPYEELGYMALEVESPLNIGFNLGALWQPMPWLTFGMNYIPAMPMTMEGEFSWTSSEAWSSVLVPLVNSPLGGQLDSIVRLLGYEFPQGQSKTEGDVTLEMEMPEQFMMGTSIKLTPRVKLNIDYKYAGWSTWEELPLELSTPIDFLRLAEYVGESTSTALVFPLGLKDTWNWAVGMEYAWSDDLVLRVGVEDRPSSLPKGGYTPLLPMGSGKLYGAGFGLTTEYGEVDFGMAYFRNTLDMPAGTSPLGNDTDPMNFIYNPFFGTDIKTELSVFLLELSISQQF